MLIARVIGNVVSTQKHRKYEGAKLMLVQPIAADGQSRGTPLLAIDSVGAGVSERVLVVLEGRAAGEALGRKAAPVDAAIVGIIDEIDVAAEEPIRDPGDPTSGAGRRAFAPRKASRPSRKDR